MRILLTGASGFLGRRIVAAARAVGIEVASVIRHAGPAMSDEVALGPGPWTSDALVRAIKSTRPDVIIHLAGATGAKDRRLNFEANTLLAGELLAAVGTLPTPPRVLLIGSAAEYGFVQQSAQPVREDFACNPDSDYGIAKLAQTMLGLAAARRGMPVLTVRLFNLVGPGMPSHLALPSFARQIAESRKTGNALKVGNLNVSRDFVDVDDAARTILELARLPIWPWPLVNLCSGNACSLRDLLVGLMTSANIESEIQVDPLLRRRSDMPELVGDASRLNALGLKPAVPNFGRLLPSILEDATSRSPDHGERPAGCYTNGPHS